MEEPQFNAHNKQEYPPMHTAEHILNQTMVRMFGCPRSKNAHIERKKSKCDYELASAPTEEQIEEIESKVNALICADVEVTTRVVTQREAALMVDLSKLPADASEMIRLVLIGDYDVCACVGSHVKHSGELGRFKILSHSYSDGMWRVRWKLELPEA